MKITVVGTGYVGLVSGACIAEVGNDVLCLDLDAGKIKTLLEGGIPIHEPELHEMSVISQFDGPAIKLGDGR